MLPRSLPPLAIPEGARRLAVAAWLAALVSVVTLSLLPQYGPPGAFQIDKAVHTFAYAFLAALPFAAFRGQRIVAWAALLMLPLGLGLEGMQSLVPQRSADLVDAIANAVGVAAGVAIGPVLRRLANRRLGPGLGMSGGSARH